MTNFPASLPRSAGTLLALAFTLSPPASAQGLATTYEPDNVIAPATGTPLPTDYSVATAGPLFAYLQRAVAGLDGGELNLSYEPVVFDSVCEVDPGGIYTGLTSLPAGDDTGDTLIAANASGLVELVPDPATGGHFPPSLLIGTPWASAQMLQTATIAGVPHIVGVSSDGMSVLTAFDLPGWMHAATISLAEQALDMVAIDFNGDGSDELAVIGFNYLRVYKADGTLILTLPSRGGNTAGLARCVTSDGEHLAWITRSLAGIPWLRIVRDDGVEIPITLSFPLDDTGGSSYDMDPIGIAAGDVDGDGEYEVVVTDQDRHRGVLFIGQGSATAHFSAATLGTDHALLLYGTPTAPTVGNSKPVLADLDGDDLSDLSLYDNSTGSLNVFLTAIGWGGAATSTGGNLGFVSDHTVWDVDENDLYTGRLNLAFELNSQITGIFTHIETVTYLYDPDLDEASQDGTHKLYQRFPMNPVGNPSIHQWVGVDLNPSDPDLADNTWDDEVIYLVLYRWVKENSAGRVVSTGMPRLGGMSVATFVPAPGESIDLCNDVPWLWDSFFTDPCGGVDAPMFSLIGLTEPISSALGLGSTTSLGGWVSDIDPLRFLTAPTGAPFGGMQDQGVWD